MQPGESRLNCQLDCTKVIQVDFYKLIIQAHQMPKSASLEHKLVFKLIEVILGAEIIDVGKYVCHSLAKESSALACNSLLALMQADFKIARLGHKSPVIVQACH